MTTVYNINNIKYVKLLSYDGKVFRIDPSAFNSCTGINFQPAGNYDRYNCKDWNNRTPINGYGINFNNTQSVIQPLINSSSTNGDNPVFNQSYGATADNNDLYSSCTKLYKLLNADASVVGNGYTEFPTDNNIYDLHQQNGYNLYFRVFYITVPSWINVNNCASPASYDNNPVCKKYIQSPEYNNLAGDWCRSNNPFETMCIDYGIYSPNNLNSLFEYQTKYCIEGNRMITDPNCKPLYLPNWGTPNTKAKLDTYADHMCTNLDSNNKEFCGCVNQEPDKQFKLQGDTAYVSPYCFDSICNSPNAYKEADSASIRSSCPSCIQNMRITGATKINDVKQACNVSTGSNNTSKDNKSKDDKSEDDKSEDDKSEDDKSEDDKLIPANPPANQNSTLYIILFIIFIVMGLFSLILSKNKKIRYNRFQPRSGIMARPNMMQRSGMIIQKPRINTMQRPGMSQYRRY